MLLALAEGVQLARADHGVESEGLQGGQARAHPLPLPALHGGEEPGHEDRQERRDEDEQGQRSDEDDEDGLDEDRVDEGRDGHGAVWA